METFIVIAVFVAAVIGIMASVGNLNMTNATSRSLQERFPHGKLHVSSEDQSYCMVDFDSSKIVLGLGIVRGGVLGVESPYENEYDFADIASVEVQRDGTTISSTNRGSQALGAAAGALAFGGVGAIIGGLSGSSTQQERVCRISLAIRVRDNNHPVHSVTFFSWTADKKGLKISHLAVKHALGQVEVFAAHLANAIHASENDAPLNSSNAPEQTRATLTEQIQQLMSMRDAGALTEAEFATAKAKLLS